MQSSRKDLCIENVREELVEVVTELLIGLGKLSNERLVNQANVKIWKMSHYRFVAFDNLGYDHLQCSYFMRLLRLFFFQIDVLDFLAGLYILLDTFFFFWLEEIIVFWIDFTDILISFHILFRFIKGHSKVISKVVKDAFCLEINAS